ncbi:unnamed protein product [Closterium sp. NIES-53]
MSAEEEKSVCAGGGRSAGGERSGGRPPGRTRLLVTGSIAVSLLLWLPVWWYTTRVYRAPLPFADISSFTHDVTARPISLPIHVDVIFLLNAPSSNQQTEQQQKQQQRQQQEASSVLVPTSQLQDTAKASLSALCSHHASPHGRSYNLDSANDAALCGNKLGRSVTLWAVRGAACQSALATSPAAAEPPTASPGEDWPCHIDWATVVDGEAQLSESEFDTWLDGRIQSAFSRSNLSESASPSKNTPWDPVARTQKWGGRYVLLLIEGRDESQEEQLKEVESEGETRKGRKSRVCASEWGEVVVGRHRHAWMIFPPSTSSSPSSSSSSSSPHQDHTGLPLLLAPMAVQSLASLLAADAPPSSNASSGSGSGSGRAELPIGPDSAVSVSWSLLNADPHQWTFQWNFPSLRASLLRPLQAAFSPLLTLHFHSQVLYFAPMAAAARWNERARVHEVQASDLPFVLNADTWHLHASLPLMAHGRSKLLHAVVYIPSLTTCPLTIASHAPNNNGNHHSPSVPPSGFISPGWGSVILFNPLNCSAPSSSSPSSTSDTPSYASPHVLSPSSFTPVLALAIAQLRSLFGLSATPPALCPTSPASPHTDSSSSGSRGSSGGSKGGVGARSLSAGLRGVAEWEVDSLLRQRLPADEATIAASLSSVAALVQSLPSMRQEKQLEGGGMTKHRQH